MAFASELPYMDPEVAKAAIAQFPKFAESYTNPRKEIQVVLIAHSMPPRLLYATHTL